jgi:sugar/nucleoside kinase (ribokinase family)
MGELVIDFISKEYVSDLSQAETFERHFGGSPANIATNLKTFGIKPLLLSRVGDDAFGKAFVERLKKQGINTDNIQIDPLHPTSVVLVSKSKETPDFLPLRGADFHIETPENVEKIVNEVKFIHFSSWPISREPSRSTILNILNAAKRADVKICFDPNYRRILSQSSEDGISLIKNILKGVFVSKPSLDDAKCLFGKMAPEEYVKTFHEFGVKNVVLTLGKDGALVSNGKKVEKIPSLAKKVIDSTGAGDAFWSGMYYSLLKGEDIFEAAKLGSATAAARVESVGSDTPLPPIKEIVKSMMK